MKRLFIAAALTTTFGVQAGPSIPIGHVMSSTITQIGIDKNGFATIWFSHLVWTQSGSCREAGMDYALGFDSKTRAGQSLLTVMLDSKAQGHMVNGEGTGTCITINGRTVETVNYLLVT